MTMWKLHFPGQPENDVFVTTKAAAERAAAVIKDFHEHPKVQAGEVYSYCLSVNGRTVYMNPKGGAVEIREVPVVDDVPVFALGRALIHIGASDVATDSN